MISSLSFVKENLGELKAKKKYGQNFLIDSNVVDKIAKNACDINMTTIEIGPGLGALTEMLLKYSKDVDAYEIDPDMYELLKKNIDDDRLNVYLGDFLDSDLGKYSDKVNVCANLPYYVTTPILFKIFESELDINKITVMVQKEVGERICAKAGDKEYSALSVEVQYLYKTKIEMNVSRKVFYPEPNVDSIIISFSPDRERSRVFENDFFEFVKNCFRMRRKTLYNNLKDLYSTEEIENMFIKTGLKDTIRAQEIELDTFIEIFRILENR